MSSNLQEDSYHLKSVKITNTWGHEVECGPMIDGIDIYESIFTNGTRGIVTITDSIGLLESMPFIGEETITLDFFVHEGDNYTKTFNIFSVKNVNIVKGSTKTYMIDFISEESELNKNIRISKGWKNVTNDIIATEVFDSIGSTQLFEVETCTTTSRLVAGNWTPFRTLRWLAENSITADGASDIVFYENKLGWFWQSLSKMKIKDHKAFLFYLGYKEKTSVNRNTIRKLSSPQLFNTFDNTRNGMYGATTYDYSIINKNMTKNYLYMGSSDRYGVSSVLGSQPPMANRGLPDNFSEDVNHSNSGKIKDEKSNLSTFKGMVEYQGIDPETIYWKKDHNLMRSSTLQGMNTQIINVEAPGDTSRICGNPISIKIPSMIPSSKGAEDVDTLYSGVYLMTAIHHKLTPTTYTQVIELRSDSIDRKVEG